MPTYEHLCLNKSCNYEWEDIYSIKDTPPTTCPECHQETAKRLISGGSGKGVVELYGQDLVDKVKADTKQLKKDMHNDPKVYDNLLGVDKAGNSRYNDMQTKMDRRGR